MRTQIASPIYGSHGASFIAHSQFYGGKKAGLSSFLLSAIQELDALLDLDFFYIPDI